MKKQINDNKSLIRISEEEGVLAMLTAAIRQADAIITGAIGSKKLELLMIPGKLLQAARNNRFLHQLSEEFEQLRQNGKIKDDYIKTEQAMSSLQELLAALENPPVDQTKFELLKSIFLKAATEEISSREDSTPQLLLSVAKELTSSEILLLASVHRLGKVSQIVDNVKTNAGRWIKTLAENSELATVGMVEYNEIKLMEKRILTQRQQTDRSGIVPGVHFRLTDLGMQLCAFFLDEKNSTGGQE